MLSTSLRYLKSKGITKINFAGGEPLLHKDLTYLLKMAKDIGFTISIVTNATLLNEHKLKEMSNYVDWIGISVDSSDEGIQKQLGRGNGKHVGHVRKVSEFVRKYGMKLKINTTITKLNYSEDMTQFILSLHPERWKVFQMLHIKGQNDDALDLILTKEEFDIFRNINGRIIFNNDGTPTFESANEMLNSYLIIGPDGDVILSKDNQRSSIPFESLKYLEISDLVDADKYHERGGSYDWD